MNDAKEILLRKTEPLKKVVMAAIMDSHEDVGRVEHSFTHWASRGLKKLEAESLRTSVFKMFLTVNKSTRSAVLPPGAESVSYVGVIINGRKVRMYPTNKLVDSKNIQDIPCEDKCEKCNQDKAICEDLTITEETSIVEVEGHTAQITVVKKLYPDGRYYLETITPVWDVDSQTVAYHTTKEFVTELDLKPCGCIEESEENIEKIKTCCPDAWACHFAGCDDNCSTDIGYYQVFEETGMIHFTKSNFDKVYIEGSSFIPKINGQYRVPKIAFEPLVEWINWKYIQHKKNVSGADKERQYELFRQARANMDLVNGRIPISLIFKYAESVPKFDYDVDYSEFCNIISSESSLTTVEVTAAANSCNEDTKDSSCCPITGNGIGLQPFQIAVIAGVGDGPTPGINSYSLAVLRNALDLNLIFVNNTAENTKNEQFTFDSATGTIYRWQGDGVTPNLWVAGDTLIANFSKKVTVGGFIANPSVSQRKPIFVIVGTTATAPTALASTWMNSNFADSYVTLFKNGTPVATEDPGTGDPYVTKSFESDTLTINNYSWQIGDELHAIITTPS